MGAEISGCHCTVLEFKVNKVFFWKEEDRRDHYVWAWFYFNDIICTPDRGNLVKEVYVNTYPV